MSDESKVRLLCKIDDTGTRIEISKELERLGKIETLARGYDDAWSRGESTMLIENARSTLFAALHDKAKTP